MRKNSVVQRLGTACIFIMLVLFLISCPSPDPEPKTTVVIKDNAGNVIKDLELTLGHAAQLNAVVKPSSAVKWKSSDAGVASVTENGMVTALDEGDAVITATAGGVSAKVNVTVQVSLVPLTGITIKTQGGNDNITLLKNKTEQLIIEFEPEDAGGKVVWVSNDWDVADVEDGLVTALEEGDTVIYAYVNGGITGNTITSNMITVNVVAVAKPATKITIMKDGVPAVNFALEAGDTAELTAAVEPAGSTDAVSWSSNHPDIASVTGGTVTAHKTGTAEITAKAGNQTGKVTVTVMEKPAVPATGITIMKGGVPAGNFILQVEDTALLTAAVEPAGSTDTVSWNSSNTAVAGVAGGLVTARTVGTADITARAGNQTSTITVTVNADVIFEWTHAKNGNISGFDWKAPGSAAAGPNVSLTGKGLLTSVPVSVSSNSNNNDQISYSNGIRFDGRWSGTALVLNIGTTAGRASGYQSSATNHAARGSYSGAFDFYNLPAGKGGIKITLAAIINTAGSGTRYASIVLNNNTSSTNNTPLAPAADAQIFRFQPPIAADLFPSAAISNDDNHRGSWDGTSFISRTFSPEDFTENSASTTANPLGRDTLKNAFFCIMVGGSATEGAVITVTGIRVEYVPYVSAGSIEIKVDTEADFSGLPDEITLVKSDSAKNQQTITLSKFTTADWYVDGGKKASGGSYTVKAEDFSNIGDHDLTIVVTVNGQLYSKTVQIQVEE